MRTLDLFSGAGGFSTGAIAAGLNVVACANHWQEAIDIHQANHDVSHLCANLLELDMARLPPHDLLLASPACQGFSTASQPGRRPKHESDRNTMWAVLSCAEAHAPHTILIENVPALYRWRLFDVWASGLEALGYIVRRHTFDTSEFDVPQVRKRAIITARLGQPLDLVSPGHEPKPFGPYIDWDLGTWYLLSEKPEGVQRRARFARERGLGDRFLLHYNSYHKGREIDRPIGTITTKNQWAVVDRDKVRMLSVDELRRGMSFPEEYVLPNTKNQAIKMLGNAIPPVFAEELCRQAMAA